MSWNTDIGVFGGSVGNNSLKAKYIFLAFLQGWFADHPRYSWTIGDTSLSKVLILDKYSYNLETAGKKPAIILSRGPMRWMNTSIAQRESLDITTGAETYSDLLEGTMSFNCIAKGGMEAEELANIVFNLLTVYKNKLSAAGIYKIHHISLSDEQALKIDSEINVSAITVNLQYSMQATVGVSPKFYNMQVQKTATFVLPVGNEDTDDFFKEPNFGIYSLPAGSNTFTLAENSDYTIVSGGNMIQFATAPEAPLAIISGGHVINGTSDGSTPNPAYGALIEGHPSFALSYLSAVSLATVTQTVSGNSSTTEFTLTEQAYGYGPLVQTIVFGYSGLSTNPTTGVSTGTLVPPGQTGTDWFLVSGYEG